MKKITLLFLFVFLGVLAMRAQEEPIVIFEDDFESYEDFIIDGIGDYILIDQDQSETYGFNGISFPNSGNPFAYMVFNSTTTTPPMDPAPGSSDWSARSGEKALAAFASVFAQNDDWLITPAITLGEGSNKLTFYAKAGDATYGLEYFNVGISTNGTEPEDFTMFAIDELPGQAEWEEFSYDLDDEYNGLEVYIAIQHVGDDQFGFLIDDISVTTGELSVVGNEIDGFSHYVSSDKTLHIKANNNFEQIEIYNLLGQRVVSQNLSSSDEAINLSSLNSGVYLTKVKAGSQSTSFKIAF